MRRSQGSTPGALISLQATPQPRAPPSTHLAAPVAEVILFAGLAVVLLQLGAVGLGRHDAPRIQVGTELRRQRGVYWNGGGVL